jgi:hypothetical protein
MAINSSTELEYHLLTALELKDITRSDCEMLTAQLVEVRKMLYGLIRALSKPNEPEQTDDLDTREEPDASPDSDRADPSDEPP